MITKLIFVCTENTYQSPIAETIFKNINRDLDLLVCSRGLVVLFPEPVNPKAETVLYRKLYYKAVSQRRS